jgi:hypothetical protein
VLEQAADVRPLPSAILVKPNGPHQLPRMFDDGYFFRGSSAGLTLR